MRMHKGFHRISKTCICISSDAIHEPGAHHLSFGVRRYSFLIMLGLAAFLGYQVAIGNSVQLNEYRGEFNSAWVGSLMSLVTTFFLGWFAFYLVKGSVTRDRETGVGQIMATTPLT